MVEASGDEGAWSPFVDGTGVGNKMIMLAAGPARVTALRLTITAAVGTPRLLQFAAFAPCATPGTHPGATTASTSASASAASNSVVVTIRTPGLNMAFNKTNAQPVSVTNSNGGELLA